MFLLEKRPRCRCFPVSSTKCLREPLYRTRLGNCYLKCLYEVQLIPCRIIKLFAEIANDFQPLPIYFWNIGSTIYVRQDPLYRNSHRKGSVRKGVLKNFAKFTKNTCASLFFNKVASLNPATLLKKRLRPRCFPVNLARSLRISFLEDAPGQQLLVISMKNLRNFPKFSV